MFSLKQKTNEIPPAAIEKNRALSLQENNLMFLQFITSKSSN